MPNPLARCETPANQGCFYAVHIKEQLASDWSQGFEGLAVAQAESGETILSGFLIDQAALHGLLARIRDLNLTLMAVNRITSNQSGKEGSDEPDEIGYTQRPGSAAVR